MVDPGSTMHLGILPVLQQSLLLHGGAKAAVHSPGQVKAMKEEGVTATHSWEFRECLYVFGFALGAPAGSAQQRQL